MCSSFFVMDKFAFLFFLVLLPFLVNSANITANSIDADEEHSQEVKEIRPEDTPCTCGVFLSGQFKKGLKDQPKGEPVLTQEIETPFLNNAVGNRQCTHRCLELIVKHLPKSSEIICATVEKDNVHREKAYLFVKNHSDKWHATNLSAGREFCCKDHEPYKCSQHPK